MSLPVIPLSIEQLTALAISLAITLAFLLALSAVAVFYLTRLPANHFANHERTQGELLWSILGWICVIAGIAMLVLPGQGLITILAGLIMAEYPGKRRVENVLFGMGRVRSAVDTVRTRAGRDPFVWPE